ncbi:hypothetical protein GW17_00015113, partial [Ensete ventricosum]
IPSHNLLTNSLDLHNFVTHQAVTKAKLGYNPLEVNPEDMVRFAMEQPQVHEIGSFLTAHYVLLYQPGYGLVVVRGKKRDNLKIRRRSLLTIPIYRRPPSSDVADEMSPHLLLVSSDEEKLHPHAHYLLFGTFNLQLIFLRDHPTCEECPLIYHLDVAAMYPNIILTNRLQHAVSVYSDYYYIRKQIQSELAEFGDGKTMPFLDLPKSEQQLRLKERLKKYCQKNKHGTILICLFHLTFQDMVVLYDSLQLAHKCILNSFYGYVMRK